MKYQYYRVRKEHRHYLGDRYFKFTHLADHTIQVCFSCGDIKKGKSNTFGVYLVHRLTFLTNYISMDRVEPCRKDVYEKKFNQIVKMLK